MRQIILLVTLSFLVFISSAQTLENTKETVFVAGEELRYKLRYGFITAAEATLQVKQTEIKFS